MGEERRTGHSRLMMVKKIEKILVLVLVLVLVLASILRKLEQDLEVLYEGKYKCF